MTVSGGRLVVCSTLYICVYILQAVKYGENQIAGLVPSRMLEER